MNLGHRSNRNRSVQISLIGLFYISVVMSLGCRESTPTAETQAPLSTSTGSQSRPTTSSVPPDQIESEQSPALAESSSIDNTNPTEVCRKFLESLQSGNRIAAENLLTRTALQVTVKAGLVLEPLSGPNSRFQFAEPRFATIKNEVAYIDCEIVDPDEEGENSYAVTWVVKKQNSQWRISGLLMELEADRPMKLVSFENIHDVEEIKLRAAETLLADSMDEDPGRQATLPSTEDQGQIK